MNIGIYKITSPSNKVYIGQSANINKRWSKYLCLGCDKQPKLYRSLKKYGPEKHKFEIIEECLIEQLSKKEVFYKQQFINEFGWEKALFCEIYDSSIGGLRSEETKLKMSNSRKGHSMYTDEWRDKISKSNKGKKKIEGTGEKISKSKIGKNRTEESKLKQSQSMKGKVSSEERNIKISKSLKGKPKSKKHKENISKGKQGKSRPQFVIEKSFKPVFKYDLEGNLIEEFKSINEAGKSIKVHPNNIGMCCRGKIKTSGGYIWKYKIQ